MRNVILFMHVSLDGFVCGPNGEQDWMTMTDEAIGKYLIPDLQTTVDTMLVGRALYQGFSSVWPTIPADPNSPQDLVDFANWMNNTSKVVFSKTLPSVDWTNSRLAQNDLAEEVYQLKQQPGGDIVVFGGAGLVAALAAQNLIDEYRIKLEPILLGEGKSLFKDVKSRVTLDLVQSKAFESGVVTLSYRVKRD